MRKTAAGEGSETPRKFKNSPGRVLMKEVVSVGAQSAVVVLALPPCHEMSFERTLHGATLWPPMRRSHHLLHHVKDLILEQRISAHATLCSLAVKISVDYFSIIE